MMGIGPCPRVMFTDSLQGGLGRDSFEQNQYGAADGHRAVQACQAVNQHPLPRAQTLNDPFCLFNDLRHVHPTLPLAFANPAISGIGLGGCSPPTRVLTEIQDGSDGGSSITLAVHSSNEETSMIDTSAQSDSNGVAAVATM